MFFFLRLTVQCAVDSVFVVPCAVALVIISKKYIRVFSFILIWLYVICAKDQHNVVTASSILFWYFEFCV